LRVGDFYSAYDNNLLLAVGEIARKISAGDKEFAFQRKLAYAGTTESSLFLLHGYAATALCLPTVNCHNRDDSEHPAIEKINRNDLRSLELVLNAIAREGIDPKGAGKRLLQAFKKRQAAGMKLLRAAYGNA
jgi:hypothetical protein